MNTEDYVTYEQAVKLKELGFLGIDCTHLYDENKELIKYDESATFYDKHIYKNCILAPTLAQVQKWLRKVKGIIIHVFIDDDTDEPWSYELLSTKRDEDGDWVYLVPKWKANFYSKEPEEALSAGIDKALELLKGENK